MAKRINYGDQVQDGELDLSMSDLQEVPVRDIALAKKATSLDLSNNRLLSLGKNFATLTHLVKLDLSKNQISSLPSNFGDLINLKALDLYSNKLNHLPLSFGRLTNLKWLDLKDNPLVPALLEIAGPCQDDKQCQSCAKKVVQVLAESRRRLDEEQARLHKEQFEREMVEKAAAKKEQQKAKKANKNEGKKKNVENGVKLQQQQQQQKQKPQKKKDKGNKQSNKLASRQSGSTCGWLIKRMLILVIIINIALGALYFLDKEKFRQLMSTSEKTAIVGLNFLSSKLNQTSEFLNNDPRVKNYWDNVKAVTVVVSDRVVNIASTVGAAIPVYVDSFYRLLFESKKTET